MLELEIRLFQLSLGYARKLVWDIEPTQFALQNAPGMNHPDWIIGHLATVADMGARLLGEEVQLPEDWPGRFGPGSKVSPHLVDYPSKDELLDAFETTSARLADLVANASEKRLQLDQPTPFFRDQLPTIGDLIAHILTTHIMLHLGQLSAWRRLNGLGSVLNF